MKTLVLLRHGESIWNRQNRFTGWEDVELTRRGVAQSKDAARLLRDSGLAFDTAFTSVLKRAIKTLWIVLEELDLMWIPVHRTWRLNERHYGALQGRNKDVTAASEGDDRILLWRRSYDTKPPPASSEDHSDLCRDLRYVDAAPGQVPATESLRDAHHRLIPYWNATIGPAVSNRGVLLVAHGNSLRALVKHLDSLSDREIVDVYIPMGVPLVYELGDDLTPTSSYYLGDSMYAPGSYAGHRAEPRDPSTR